MAVTDNFKPVAGSERMHAASHQVLNPTAAGQTVTATLIVRRTPRGTRLKKLEEFSPRSSMSRADLASTTVRPRDLA